MQMLYIFGLIATLISPLLSQVAANEDQTHQQKEIPMIFLGIAGGSGSGKTTVAQKICSSLGESIILIEQDNYYRDLSHLSFEERTLVNFDHPNSIDFVLMREHLLALKEGTAIEKPIYNFQSHSREKSASKVEPARVIIVEGILLFAIPEVRELLDIKVFVDTEDDIRLLRRIERDMAERGRDFESIKLQYLTTVKPMHLEFVEPSKRYADIIIPRGGENRTAVNLIISKLKAHLREHQ